jgi:hypothetical protein
MRCYRRPPRCRKAFRSISRTDGAQGHTQEICTSRPPDDEVTATIVPQVRGTGAFAMPHSHSHSRLHSDSRSLLRSHSMRKLRHNDEPAIRASSSAVSSAANCSAAATDLDTAATTWYGIRL